MKQNLFKLSILAAITLTGAACSEGEYNDLKCDSDYQSECITTTKYMTCLSNQLVVIECEAGTYCKDIESDGISSADCVSYASDNTPVVTPRCGDGKIDAGEDCDGANLNNKSCANIIPNSTGRLACNPATCKFDTTNCQGDETATCGNGQIDEGEDCDGTNLNNKVCSDVLADSEGTLACNDKTCFFDATQCTVKEEPVFPGCKSDTDCQSESGETLSCQNGICLSEEMKNAEIGSDCDPRTFVEYCSDNDEIVYCEALTDAAGKPVLDDEGNKIYKVGSMDCGDSNGCTIVDLKEIYGVTEPVLSAWCKNHTMKLTNEEAAAVCSKEGKVPFCAQFDGFSAPLESYYLCLPNNDGDFTALEGLRFGEYNYCYSEDGTNYGVCAADGTVCENHEVVFCDYDYQCVDESTIAYCSVDYYTEGTITCDTVLPGSVCANVDGVDSCYETCSELGATHGTCEEDDEGYIAYIEYTCTKGLDGNMYDYGSGMYCNHECDPNQGCVNYVSDEHQKCDTATYTDRCENNNAVSCDGGYVTAEACLDKSCQMLDDYATCLETCTTPNEISEYCTVASIFGLEIAVNTISVCTETENGLFFIESDYNGCNNGCADDHKGCKKLVEDEGTHCDNAGEMIRCQDDVLVYCDQDNTIGAYKCDNDHGYDTCAVSPTLGPSCVKTCDELSAPAQICVTDDDPDYDEVYYDLYIDSCEDINGTHYAFTKWLDECEEGCNADNTDCAE